VRIAWVDDDGDTEGLPRSTGKLGSVFRGCRRKRCPLHVRKGDAGLLEGLALEEDAGNAAPALGAVPRVLVKTAARVLILEGGADALLQLEEKGAGVLNVLGQIDPAAAIVTEPPDVCT